METVVYLVKRNTSSTNDWMDYGQCDQREDVVGTFESLEQAKEAAALVDSWPRREEGCDTEEDEDGNTMSRMAWSAYHGDCTITVIITNKLLIEPPNEKYVAQAVASDKAKEERKSVYDSTKAKEEAASKLFKSLGAAKHHEDLAFYLSLAGCYTQEQLMSFGAQEFVGNSNLKFWRGQWSSFGSSDELLIGALRDFKDSLK